MFISPYDVGDKTRDNAYVARLTCNNRQLLVVASAFDDMTVTETGTLWGPKVHS